MKKARLINNGNPWSSFWNSLSDEEKIEWKK
jgi:hypothetical protein